MRVLILLGACLALCHTAYGQGRRVCHYDSSTQYRPEGGKLWPEGIDPFLCTEVVFHKAVINNECEMVEFDWNHGDLYSRINALKSANTELKTLLAVARSGSTCDLSIKDNRLAFAEDSLTFLRANDFDGIVVAFDLIDLDYPNFAEDFSALLQEIRAAYDAEDTGAETSTLLLAAAVSAIKAEVDQYYNMADIANEVDWIDLKTYDFRGPNRLDVGVTYHAAPLYPRSDETGDDEYLNVDAAVNYWIGEGGVASDKLIMGVGGIGVGFKLENISCVDVGCAITGPSQAGSFTRQPGFHAMFESCSMYMGPSTGPEWDEEQLVSYTVSEENEEWVSHENTLSLVYKAEWSVDNNLAGWSLWSLDTDDFEGTYCGLGAYPILSALNSVTNPDYVRDEVVALPADN